MKLMASRISRCLPFFAFAGLLAIAGCNRLPPDVAANETKWKSIRESIDAGGTTAAAGSTANAGTPTGWATLKGKFKINGTATRATLPVDKDKEVCAPGGKPVLSDEFVVDGNGGVKDVLLYLTQTISDDEPWTHPSAKSGKNEQVVFDQKACIFLSHVLAIQATQPMLVKNSDPIGHNTAMKPRKNAASDLLIPGGGEAVYQAKKEEDQPFPVSCAIHPWMKANIIFRTNSYYAVTKPDGTFEIPNLPAGVELEFRAWQEKSNFIQSVTVNGKAEKWSKGKFKLTLTPNEPKELEIVLDVK